MYLGIDTSNYTTSAAAFGSDTAKNVSRLLDVKEGELGLRQSDALFQHVKRLPLLIDELLEYADGAKIRAIAASTRPRAVEGSYMPCFLAGESLGRSAAKMLGVPFHAFSHQQGHVAAALWSAGRLDLMDKPHLAWHLSGGTTELLYVEPDGCAVKATKLGGTTDISAGQVIDRAGQRLQVPFPAGKSLDALAQASNCKEKFAVKLQGYQFSFSGLENKVRDFMEAGNTAEDVAAYTLNSVIHTVYRASKAALQEFPGLEIVFSGGVASNTQLRNKCAEFSPVFAKPEFSTDNAMGIAVLCSRQEAQ